MQIYVKTQTGKTIALDVKARGIVKVVKHKLEKVKGIDTDPQMLFCQGKQVVDTRTFQTTISNITLFSCYGFT